MPNLMWWYDKLQMALGALFARRDFEDEMGLPAMMAMTVLMENIKRNQPHGHIEEDASGYAVYAKPPRYTVSSRIGHTPIEDGWRESIETLDDGNIRMRIRNVSEHIRVVITGTDKKEYAIPSTAPFVFFWWGAPQRWPPLDGNDPGYRKFPVVSHPGQEANPFVAVAVQQSKPSMTRFVGSGVSGWIRNLMWKYGLRER